MKSTAHRIPRIPLALVICACALLALAATTPLLQPARADLPPRPTHTPIPTPTPPGVVGGGAIQLQVQFPQALAYPWQELWTVVQWQDHQGHWHDVQGWQGTLDGVAIEDGRPVGHKTWWVAEKDFGTGPFRWVITQGKDGALLAASKSFDLPSFDREMVIAEVLLE